MMTTQRVAITGWTVLALLGLGKAPAVVPAGPPFAIPVQVEAQDAERTQTVHPDGTVFSGGHLGVELACTPGPQAFAKKSNPDGSLAWLLTANADDDCDGDGQGDGGGQPLLAGWTLFDQDYIIASTLSDSVIHPSGDTLWTGSMLTASILGGLLQAAWGAFAIRLDPDGVLMGQAFFGDVPTGDPADVATCVALCNALTESTLGQVGGETIAHQGAVVAIGGSKRVSSGGEIGDKDVFLAQLTDDLASTTWIYHLSRGGDDEVLDVTFEPGGDLFATGFFGSEHDGFVARFAGATGELTHAFSFYGPLDDEGYLVTVDEEQNPGQLLVKLYGFFTGSAVFGGELIVGEGVTNFTACLTEYLDLLSVDTGGGGPQQLTGQARAQVPDRDPGIQVGSLITAVADASRQSPAGAGGASGEIEDNDPNAVEILIGQNGNCDPESALDHENCVDQVADSDDEYMHLYGVYESEDADRAEILLQFPLSEQKPRLRNIGLEITSDYCMEIEVLIGGGLAADGEFLSLGTIDLCALNEPVLTIDVPPAMAQQLGFWNDLPPNPLLCKLSIVLFGIPCGTCQGGGKELSLDEGEAGSDYPP